MAVNYYCGSRYTEDVDAFYNRRLHMGPCEVNYRHKDGNSSFLYLDNNYNPPFGLLHGDHDRDAVEWTEIGNERRKIHLYVLSPVDLAVTKISRYSRQDQEDILALANAELISAGKLRDRAIEALGDFIGDRASVMTSIEDICRQISAVKSPQLSREADYPADPSSMNRRKEPDLEI